MGVPWSKLPSTGVVVCQAQAHKLVRAPGNQYSRISERKREAAAYGMLRWQPLAAEVEIRWRVRQPTTMESVRAAL
jgi:hypothetical protein